MVDNLDQEAKERGKTTPELMRDMVKAMLEYADSAPDEYAEIIELAKKADKSD